MNDIGHSAIADHHLYLFYAHQRDADQWDQPPDSGLLSSLITPEQASPAWIYPDAQARIKDDYGHHPIWEDSTLPLGSDLHPHILGALGEVENPNKASRQPKDAKVFQLTPQASNIFLLSKLLLQATKKPLEARQPKVLQLKLGPSAKQRIKAQTQQEDVPNPVLKIRDCKAISFRTGWVIFWLDIQVEIPGAISLHPVWLQEVLAKLSKVNSLSWCEPESSTTTAVPQPQAQEPQPFALGEVISGLGGNIQTCPAKRTYTSTFMRFEQHPDPDLLDKLLVRLSRHYTDAYDIVDEQHGIQHVGEFNTVQHRFALEGTATAIISSQKDSDFLYDYHNATYLRHYLPITLLAVHEYFHLVSLTNDSGFWPEINTHDNQSLQQLEILRDKILKFRLCFRYSTVSRIGMHNDTNKALRKVFNLNEMLTELDLDTQEISAFLEKKSVDLLNKRFHWMSVTAGGFVAFWSTHELIKEFSPLVSLCIPLTIDLGISVALGAIAALFISKKGH